MKLLLDENLPKKLKMDFLDFEIYTVSDMKWNSKKNGELLKLMFFWIISGLVLVLINDHDRFVMNAISNNYEIQLDSKDRNLLTIINLTFIP